MSLQQMIAWVQAGQILVTSGIATVNNIRTWIKQQTPGMTDEQMDEILAVIIAEASRHKTLADADAGGRPPGGRPPGDRPA